MPQGEDAVTKSLMVGTQDGTLGAVFFANCYNISAYNATFYYDISQNPWYQATLTDISADGITWNITVGTGCMLILMAIRALGFSTLL